MVAALPRGCSVWCRFWPACWSVTRCPGCWCGRLQSVSGSPWLAVPAFVAPEFHMAAILFMIPVAIAPAIEHIGDVLAIGGVTGKNYLEKPGLQNTLLGDGIATSAAAFFGGPPNTTYSEVTGAVMLTRNFNPNVMIWAAVFAIGLAFVDKFGAVLLGMPVRSWAAFLPAVRLNRRCRPEHPGTQSG
ncbi:solute carrier family 23 protein [Halopseudomonas pachastrellae]|nr:solute carrier family 23 protein [Halopseudomonas pachastrellae]